MKINDVKELRVFDKVEFKADGDMGFLADGDWYVSGLYRGEVSIILKDVYATMSIPYEVFLEVLDDVKCREITLLNSYGEDGTWGVEVGIFDADETIHSMGRIDLSYCLCENYLRSTGFNPLGNAESLIEHEDAWDMSSYVLDIMKGLDNAIRPSELEAIDRNLSILAEEYRKNIYAEYVDDGCLILTKDEILARISKGIGDGSIISVTIN